jgi:hypothetical protein
VGPRRGSANPALSYVLTTVGVAVVGMILVVRRTLVLRSATTLAEKPEDGLTLNHWKTGYIATYALCETLALFGLILRFMGFGLQQSVPFYVGGFVLLFFFGRESPRNRPPRTDRRTSCPSPAPTNWKACKRRERWCAACWKP